MHTAWHKNACIIFALQMQLQRDEEIESVPVLGSISVKQLWFACEYTLAKKLNEAVIIEHSCTFDRR